ncbi:hypothetical protein HHK36_027406 [Tetracentron sinense]|uniref:Galactose oxidase n=1 Tax=Tetracentron sinense TaxID=13715 RepID=A0A834YD69_TETSI|nr:hypothetical protein HHK36_027406 [Tetracentron sinense]
MRTAMEARAAVFLLFTVFSFSVLAQNVQNNKGRWKLLKRSIGISAMHMALLPNDRVITFDRTDFGPSNITLPGGRCRKDSRDEALKKDCYAHSVEFNPANRNVRPLTVLTDTWCSSGALSKDGVLVQSGGYNDGERSVRFFKPCGDCDWEENPNGLVSRRWYASNQILPNGKIIVVGGSMQFSYEFIPKSMKSDYTEYQLPFLKETKDPVDNNLYPFLHLSTDGNLFIFANKRAILLDYVKNRVIKNYPEMPGGVSRNHPSTGSSVLLPLRLMSTGKTPDAEVFICGGAPSDSNNKTKLGIYVPASKTCGRLIITAANPKWEMEEMPMNRVMGDMILLPTEEVLIINGAAKGTAGWGASRGPVLNPVLYRPNAPRSFQVMNPSMIPRLYHSTAHLIPDGRILVGGSNPNINYNFTVPYPTELSLESFSPPYLSSGKSRPKISWVKPGTEIAYNQKFSLGFELKGKKDIKKICVTMSAPTFTTHSFSMNQRLLVLAVQGMRRISGESYAVDVYAPATNFLAPPGYYLLFVVHGGVPSRGSWVRIN